MPLHRNDREENEKEKWKLVECWGGCANFQSNDILTTRIRSNHVINDFHLCWRQKFLGKSNKGLVRTKGAASGRWISSVRLENRENAIATGVECRFSSKACINTRFMSKLIKRLNERSVQREIEIDHVSVVQKLFKQSRSLISNRQPPATKWPMNGTRYMKKMREIEARAHGSTIKMVVKSREWCSWVSALQWISVESTKKHYTFTFAHTCNKLEWNRATAIWMIIIICRVVYNRNDGGRGNTTRNVKIKCQPHWVCHKHKTLLLLSLHTHTSYGTVQHPIRQTLEKKLIWHKISTEQEEWGKNENER